MRAGVGLEYIRGVRPRKATFPLNTDEISWWREMKPWSSDPRLLPFGDVKYMPMEMDSDDQHDDATPPNAYFLHKKIQRGFEGPTVRFILATIAAVTLRADDSQVCAPTCAHSNRHRGVTHYNTLVFCIYRLLECTL
eukprot:Platyproteum_vivax@DN251_c0_g1_i1.p1